MYSSPSFVQQKWRCSSSLEVLQRPRTAGILASPSIVVKAAQGEHISRRDVGVATMTLLCIAALLIQHPHQAHARQRRNTKSIPIQDYKIGSDGIKYYDLIEGKGVEAKKGSTVLVHFDCVYRGLTVVSTRESKLLAGNRAISQPYEFTVGAVPGKERKRDFVDNPNGLFSAQAAPKPPPALYTIIEGMREGGQRTVIVTPEVGYGKRSMNEIPPNGTFDLNLELLKVKLPAPEK
ncbi:hypothetical protein KI387_024358 [Taxus chinensis]|uniref:peptidylprolyl isomerase n=1 Tax=Taxus chinensis TaxID=29808 RepID=A0AA38G3H5_TAXCH|nr:hypothetical protein KI387_024358 [Taxus chinensis]